MKLRFLVEKANSFDCVVIIVGNNDLNSKTDQQIIHNLKQFEGALEHRIKLKICGFLPRRDHPWEYNAEKRLWENPVTRINNKLRSAFPKSYASPGKFKLEDFKTDDKCHLNDLGQKHMAHFVYNWCKLLMR